MRLPRLIVQIGVASPHLPNIAKIINAGATQNEIQSDIMSSEPPRSCCFEYFLAIGPSMISPIADNRIHNIAAHM